MSERVFLRLSIERLLASGATEVDPASVVFGFVLCAYHIYHHAADGVSGFFVQNWQRAFLRLDRRFSSGAPDLNNLGKNAHRDLFR